MLGSSEYVKTQYEQLTGREILRASPSVLNGVSEAQADSLKTLEIYTVFDLATSRFFVNASHLLEDNKPHNGLYFKHGQAPSDVVDRSLLGQPLEDLRFKDVSILNGIDAGLAATLATALDIQTVRDMALWPPYQAARSLLTTEYMPDNIPGIDPEAPPDLLPKSGDYPTERHFYKTLVMDAIQSNPDQLKPIESAGPIDLAPSTSSEFGFSSLATGALLTFSQSWFAQGVALGGLLHSITLAPGESTRIAVLDWSRRTYGSRNEGVTESEALSNSMLHSRAMSEVTDAVATETQTGFSKSHEENSASQAGGGLGIGIGPITFGGSASGSSSSSTATSFSTSSGRREIAAEFSQKIADSTQQNASSVRNRRASVVEEISQSEHESISTRVLTNYNHMHALSVQYYEVVQIYRMAVQLAQAERCLFVPIKLINFRQQQGDKFIFVEKYRSVLANAAISSDAYRMLTRDYGVVEVIPSRPKITIGTLGVFGNLGSMVSRPFTRMMLQPEVGIPATGSTSPRIDIATTISANPQGSAGNGDGGSHIIDGAAGSRILSTSSATMNIVRAKGWNVEQLASISSVLGRSILRGGEDNIFLPDDVSITGLTVEDFAATQFQVKRRSGNPVTYDTTGSLSFESPIPVVDLEWIKVNLPSEQDFDATVVLYLDYLGTRFPLNVPVRINRSRGLQTIMDFGGVRASNELIEHLEANKLHYSQAIYRSLDSATIALLLSPYKYGDQPIAQQIDPNPITVTGNYLVFRMPAEEYKNGGDGAADHQLTDWGGWLKDHGLDRSIINEEVIPLPSGGVFAEAVLGRYNSAEKLDITRFWNWQDSPIPIQAPEIAPISMGSRAQPEDLKAGGFSAPLVSIQNPTPLPDAAGVGAALTAIQNGNMFRDMSGLAATIGLAQAGMAAANNAATSAGQQAGSNMAVAAQKEVEMAKIAASMAAAMMGVPAPGSSSPSTISNEGAKINHGADMDARGVAGASPSGPTGSSGGSSGDGNGSSSGGGGGGGMTGGGTGGGGPLSSLFSGGNPFSAGAGSTGGTNSFEAGAFGKALWGSVGEPSANLVKDVIGTIANPFGALGINTSQSIRDAAVAQAKHEYESVWNKSANKENQPAMRSVLVDYYQAGVGMSRSDILSEYHNTIQQLHNAGKDNEIPAGLVPLASKDLSALTETEKDNLLTKGFFVSDAWSAVFISWLMEKAGAGAQFKKARAHWRYVAAAKANRQNNDTSNRFWAYRYDEVKPEVGDIVVKSRNGSQATWDAFENKNTHGDIVIEINGNKMKTIGGNLGNSVNVTEVTLSSNGMLPSTGGMNDDYFAIVKVK